MGAVFAMAPSISPNSSAIIGVSATGLGMWEPGVECHEYNGLLAADLLQNPPDTLQGSTMD
jgi:hypothetical protein